MTAISDSGDSAKTEPSVNNPDLSDNLEDGKFEHAAVIMLHRLFTNLLP